MHLRATRVSGKGGAARRALSARTTSGTMARAALWSACAFVLNLAWEIAQVRLYTVWAEADGPGIFRALLHCSLGDAVIALVMFALAGIVVQRADWPASRPWAGGAIVVIGAMCFTAWSEWYNVYRAGNWGYAASMPMIFGIGLSPMLQWLILPPAIVASYRALTPLCLAGAALSGERSTG